MARKRIDGIDIRNYSHALRDNVSGRTQPRRSIASGYVSAVHTDVNGKIVSATVQVPGSGTIRSMVPFGSNVYTGMGVYIENYGSPSNASWAIAGTSYLPTGSSGGAIYNQNGNLISMFENIWVKEDGFIRAGGTEDPDGNPTGSRLELTEVGLFGWSDYDEKILGVYVKDATEGDYSFQKGDMFLGSLEGGHLEISPENHRLGIYNGDGVIFRFDQVNGNRITGMLWIGDESGPQAGIGRLDESSVFVLRDIGTGDLNNVGNEPRVMFAANPTSTTALIGDPDRSSNFLWYDSSANGGAGEVILDASVRIRDATIYGESLIAEGGYIATHDEGTLAGLKMTDRYLEGTGTGGDRTFLLVGAAVTLPKHPQLPVYGNKSWVGGEGYWGDLLHRHFRIERGASARIGLFDADTPLVWADFEGNAYVKGQLTARDGEVIVGREGNGIEVFLPVGSIDEVQRLFTFVDQNYVPYGGVWSGSDSTTSEALLTNVNRVNMHFGTYAELTSIANARSDVRILSNSHANRQAKLKLQAAGNNGAADQAMIELISYGGDDGAYGMIRMTGVPRLVQRTAAPSATTGQSVSNGLFAFPDGSGWNPNSYIGGDSFVARLGGAWPPFAQEWGTPWRWGDGGSNYTEISGSGVLSFATSTYIDARYSKETKNTAGGPFTISKRFTRVNVSGGSLPATLPDAATATGKKYTLKKVDSSNYPIVVTAAGSDTVEGASTYSIYGYNQSVTFFSNGSLWEVYSASDRGYPIMVQCYPYSPVDAQTTYFGNVPVAPTTATGVLKVRIPKSGTIKRAYLESYSVTAGSNESWSVYLRLNGSSDTLIATVAAATNARSFTNTSLNIPVVAGDYIEIKSVNPTWATNPVTTFFGGNIHIE